MPTHPEFRSFPSSCHEFSRKKVLVKTSIKFMGPCKILQLYSKYFFSYEFLKFGHFIIHFCHSLYVYPIAYFSLDWG